MVTPSLQTIGAPQLFKIRTDFDFGPSVTRTASARSVAPRNTFFAGGRMKQDLLVGHSLLLRGAISSPCRATSPIKILMRRGRGLLISRLPESFSASSPRPQISAG